MIIPQKSIEGKGKKDKTEERKRREGSKRQQEEHRNKEDQARRTKECGGAVEQKWSHFGQIT